MAVASQEAGMRVCPRCGGSYPVQYRGCPRCVERDHDVWKVAATVVVVLLMLLALYGIAQLSAAAAGPASR